MDEEARIAEVERELCAALEPLWGPYGGGDGGWWDPDLLRVMALVVLVREARLRVVPVEG